MSHLLGWHAVVRTKSLAADVIFQAARDKLKVTIFYESECSDCVDLFRDQLLPNYESFARYIKLDFVPYGKATVSCFYFYLRMLSPRDQCVPLHRARFGGDENGR